MKVGKGSGSRKQRDGNNGGVPGVFGVWRLTFFFL